MIAELSGSCIRQWRDLTRLRKKYVHTVGDYRKRTNKLFESANIKIDSVVSDRLKQASGIADVASREILAEIGTTLDSFPKDTSLVAWCGLPNMFYYLDDQCIAATTNKLEGYFSRLKEIYRKHRGMSKKHRQNYFAWYINF